MSLIQDLRYAWRGLLASGSFAPIAVLTLALGVGANTAIFSLVDALLLRPLPFQDSEDLVMIWEHNRPRGKTRNVVGPANYLRWRDHQDVFSEMVATWTANMVLTGEGEPERIPIALVTPGFFSLLGVSPVLGRSFLPEEERESADVVVLSNGFWGRHGADPDVIGSTMTVNGQPCTVVGVAPPRVEFPSKVDMWAPIALGEQARSQRGRWLFAVGRLAEGVDIDRAHAAMNVIAARLEEETPDFNKGWGVNLVPLRTQIVGDLRGPLWLLLGAVGFVLLIACANVGGLLLARATTRGREMAIRASLGAGRWRLIRQMLTESLLLSVLGGGAGLLLAFWILEALPGILPEDLPRFNTIGMNAAVLSFSLLATVLSGILAGLAPSLQLSRADLAGVIKTGGRGYADGRPERHWLRSVLVVSEMALALVLLIGAGLLVRSLTGLGRVDPGYETRGILTTPISLPSRSYREDHHKVAFFREAVERIEALPGVRSAGAVSYLPLAGPGSATSFTLRDRPAPAVGEEPVADVRSVTSEYFRTMGIPLLAGRFFDSGDGPDVPHSVLINETMARTFWPDSEPLGKTVVMSWGEDLEARVIGVVGDVKLTDLQAGSRSTLYWHHPQFTSGSMTLVVATEPDPVDLAPAVRAVIAAIDPDQPVEFRTMASVLAESIARERFMMLLMGAFAFVALTLASIGIYGIMSQAVNERRHEMGVRIALGARAGQIFGLVLRRGIFLTGIGLILGTLGAIGLTRLLETLLFGVSATDTVTFGAVTIVMAGAAFLACYLPARRATRVDPNTILRYE